MFLLQVYPEHMCHLWRRIVWRAWLALQQHCQQGLSCSNLKTLLGYTLCTIYAMLYILVGLWKCFKWIDFVVLFAGLRKYGHHLWENRVGTWKMQAWLFWYTVIVIFFFFPLVFCSTFSHMHCGDLVLYSIGTWSRLWVGLEVSFSVFFL